MEIYNLLLRRSLNTTLFDRGALVGVHVLDFVARLIVRGRATTCHRFTNDSDACVGLGVCTCYDCQHMTRVVYKLQPLRGSIPPTGL